MTFSINYQKKKNTHLFQKLGVHHGLSHLQNYIPTYRRFFALNDSNWNTVVLNHPWHLTDVNKEVFKVTHLETKKVETRPVFMKMAPLLDPFKYLVGKYDHKDPQLFQLPSVNSKDVVHSKLSDVNNASFVDGFFAYLSCQTLHAHNMYHGLEYYGSVLGIKNNYTINAFDDLEYLLQSDFFLRQHGKLYTCDFVDAPKEKLTISTAHKSNSLPLTFDTLDDCLFEGVFSEEQEEEKQEEGKQEEGKQEEAVVFEPVLTHINEPNEDVKVTCGSSASLSSSSSCSSRKSFTDDEKDFMSETSDQCDAHVDNEDSTTVWSDEDDDGEEDDHTPLVIHSFPVQVICMEKCDNTFADLISSKSMTNDEWMSALMQIIMALIAYQRMFSFTHNDLHTNNVMYVNTKISHLYYVFNKKTYKVPTYGKIYKLIDFGRAIYKYNGQVFCSDSFQSGGDADTQYNTEPFFNPKKPRIEPNFSFDLCRLACSIFDYVVGDLSTLSTQRKENPLVNIIADWCTDDNGLNVLYKSNGVERYPEFKLYKMIARCVHQHTPQNQLERPEFGAFVVTEKPRQCMNIDAMQCYQG